MQKSRIEERTESERARNRSEAPYRPGFLTEAALADRWGRSRNTLVGWRTRPHAGHQAIAFELHNGHIYYAVETIRAYEADPRNARIRPVSLRGVPFPPLAATLAELHSMQGPAVQAELPLCSVGELTSFEDRGFERLTISAGYALAVANDGTAWWAEVLGGLSALAWKRVNDLPFDAAAFGVADFPKAVAA